MAPVCVGERMSTSRGEKDRSRKPYIVFSACRFEMHPWDNSKHTDTNSVEIKKQRWQWYLRNLSKNGCPAQLDI